MIFFKGRNKYVVVFAIEKTKKKYFVIIYNENLNDLQTCLKMNWNNWFLVLNTLKCNIILMCGV